METKKWLATVSGDATVNAIAREAQVPQKTLDTQLRSATGLKPEMVVKIARAYHYPPVRALVDLGLVTPEEALDAAGARAADVAEALRLATAEQLANEISNRLATIEEERAKAETAADDLAKKRGRRRQGRPPANAPVDEAAREQD